MESAPIHTTSQSFDKDVLQSDIPVVVDFWAPWCGPCRSIGPVLEGLSKTWAGKVKVAKVNVDEEPALAKKYGIQGIPTLHVIRGGKVVQTVVGFRGAAPLEKLFEQMSSTAPAVA